MELLRTHGPQTRRAPSAGGIAHLRPPPRSGAATMPAAQAVVKIGRTGSVPRLWRSALKRRLSAPPPGPLAGFPSDAYFLSSLRFRRSAGIRPSTCRRAAVWHWAVTSLPRSSVARRGPSPSPRKTQSSPATDHPLPEMSKNRQGELDALTSERFTAAVKARNAVLITYRELITRQGLKAMRRPAG